SMIVNSIKIILSLLLSALIGIEREKQDKPAGLRTVMLVCLGATLFALVGLQFSNVTNNPRYDILRLLYAPIVGIGFLGGGVIMKRKKDIEGITTASTLWVMVAVGLLCGIGEYYLAVLSTLFTYLVLLLGHWEIKIKKKRKLN
ncbi:MAG: hypothetical protein DRO67_09725, partial [Candidatus Asgardarchaeum californiense]